MLRLLLTRPEPEASRSAEILRQRGYEVRTVPLMQIEQLEFDPMACLDADGFILTSQRAAFALPEGQEDKPVFATGARTAKAARARGYARIASAEGDWHDLAELIVQTTDQGQTLCHLCGQRQRGDIRAYLGSHGIHYQQLIVYTAKDLHQPTSELRAWLNTGEPGCVLFYSPATAAIWQNLNLRAFEHHAICISVATAAELRADRWARIAVANSPNEEALWQCLETIG